MSSERREVSATLEFFQDLDRQLRDERGPSGEPSTNDFQTFELLEIVERFATGFDDLAELIPGRRDYRVLISTGVLQRNPQETGSLSGHLTGVKTPSAN